MKRKNLDFNWKEPIRTIHYPDGDKLVVTRFKSKETIVIEGQQRDQPVAKPQIAMVLLHPKKDEDKDRKKWLKMVDYVNRKKDITKGMSDNDARIANCQDKATCSSIRTISNK